MANFQGEVVPATVKRLRGHFVNNPDIYNQYIPGTGMEEALIKADDILDDGVINNSGEDIKPEVDTIIPITGVDATIDVSEFDMVEGGTQEGTITPSVIPANTTLTPVYTYESDDEEVATVENGTVTAVAEGLATITVGIEGTSFTKDLDIEVVDTTV